MRRCMIDRRPRMFCRYVMAAERRSTVPEAAYSELNIVGGRRSRRRRSVRCCTVTASFVSVLLNIAMSAAALVVILSVTSPGSDVVCTLLRCLLCQTDDTNCTSRLQTDYLSHTSALHSFLQTVGLMSAFSSRHLRAPNPKP